MIRAIQFQNKRVGSTFLQNAIDSHPDIMGINEVFVNMAKKPGMRKSGFVPFLKSDADTPKEYIEDVINITYPTKNTIFKLMYNQIGYHAGLMQYIRNNKIPMIHLMRRNLVKQIISGMTAATTKHDPVPISGKDLLHAVQHANNMDVEWAETMKAQIKLTLYYEDIIGVVADGKTYVSSNTNIAICDFFNVKQVRLYANTKKKNKEDLKVYLKNYNGIKQAFKGSKFDWMLN